jgi:hypothetical protein
LVQANPRRHELRQKLGELPQLEQRGVRVIGKVPLREHAQAQELCVVLLQVGEVAGEKRRLVHRLVHVQPQMEYLWINRSFGPKALYTATPDSYILFAL